MGAFPFHTDMVGWTTPPKYILLTHHHGDRSVPTLLLDLNPLQDSLKRDLQRGIWSARGARGTFLFNSLAKRRGTSLFRWDELFMRPENDTARAATSALLDRIATVGSQQVVSIFLGHVDAVLVIDNWRLLHGRPRVPEASGDRTLERFCVGERLNQ